MIEIRSLNGTILYTAETAADVKAAIVEAVSKGANLRGANLRGANLGGANLDGANLGGAYLDGANLRGADLDGADLDGANLDGANLRGAYLRGAYLGESTRLETGETWKEFLTIVVPAFLTAGGRMLIEVATPEHWDCHGWDNCPTAAAFGCKAEDGVPLLLRPRARQFIMYFDAKLIPLEAIRPDLAVVKTP